MTASAVANVVVAAGGLGTRVADWARYMPKEFQAVAGRPGLVHLLDEIATLGPARVAVVYHPYYQPFITWAKTCLSAAGAARYYALAHRPDAELHRWPELDVHFVPQHGTYADITSVLNGVEHLGTGEEEVLVAFADNLYPDCVPLRDLARLASGPAVLARPFDPAAAPTRGVIICSPTGTFAELVEKPTPARVAELAQRHGPANLRLLEGRARLTSDLVTHLATATTPRAGEPKLSLALADYARHHAVQVLTTHSSVIDLGTPAEADVRRPPGPRPVTHGPPQQEAPAAT